MRIHRRMVASANTGRQGMPEQRWANVDQVDRVPARRAEHALNAPNTIHQADLARR
jgi:hypothetical protein